MSQSKCKASNNIAQHQAVSANEFSYDLCDNTRNKNEIFIEKSAILNPEHKNVESQRARLSSSEGDDIQETPIDFSLPKRMKISPDSPETFSEQKTPYVSSSPPLNVSSQRTTPDNLHEAGSNGSKSPSNLYSEHPNTSSNLELFANGHIMASRLSPEVLIRERSHSFSNLKKIRHGHSAHHSHGISSNSGVGPLSTHHLNNPALIRNVTPPTTYGDLVPQSMSVCTSPNVTDISSLTPDEVLHLYNDRIGKLSNDNCHYAFLPSGVPSCIAESLGGNGLLTSHPNILPSSSLPGATSLHHNIPPGRVTPEISTTNSTNLIATVKSTSPVTASGPTTKRRPQSLPDEQKDEAYWERRRKNNEAAKRSRDARRVKEEEIALRANFLEQENLKLRCEVATLKTETEKLRVLLYDN